MKHFFEGFERREASLGRPLHVGVIGAGFFGSGSIRQLAKVKGVRPSIVASRTLKKAESALLSAGVARDQIVQTDDRREAAELIAQGRFVITSDVMLPCLTDGIEVILEATGDIEVGAETALAAIENGKHVVAANLETQATFGHLIAHEASKAGVVYTDVDGDQPGLIMNLWHYCQGLGMEPLVAGNCKGVLKRYATPETQARFAHENGIAPWIATAAADGTKICIEMAAVANATGAVPQRPGMSAIETTLDNLLPDLSAAGLLRGGPFVEYTLGIPVGTFVVARSEEPDLRRDFAYLKMGDGPEYLFYDPRVLGSFDVPVTIAKAVLFHSETMAPEGRPVAQVATYAKRDLPAGTSLDGIGGYDTYGLVVTQQQFEAEDLLPVGLSARAVLNRDIDRDAPITFADVSLDPASPLMQLWERQASIMPKPKSYSLS